MRSVDRLSLAQGPQRPRSVRQAPSQALSSHAAGASQRTFHHRVTVTKERPETRLFCKLLVARDVDPVDASAVVSLARLDRLAADRAHKLFVVLAIPHRSPPSALQREDGRSSAAWCVLPAATAPDRKSTRLNSSHRCISYAVFCLKKKIDRRTSRTS